jgi:hypothetical protein
MRKKENYLDLILFENYKNELDLLFRAYNINREKIELFHDFIISLHELINNTYLGPDYINTEQIQEIHFTWCWDKTINNFTKENIFFKERGFHFEYFMGFYFDAYYQNETEDVYLKMLSYYNSLFDFNISKPKKELEIFFEVYKLLEQTLKK